ncbi:MAG: hypothetical protein IID40_04835 [Planctomycetes bacterium]|nr:hypothetical protein [Planctomycetota bacterium]
MNTPAILTIVAFCWSVTSPAGAALDNADRAAAGAGAPQVRVIMPPSRPLPITADQAAALRALSDAPQHAAARVARASYSPEAARRMTEFGVHATQAVLPSALLLLLIAAAPL